MRIRLFFIVISNLFILEILLPIFNKMKLNYLSEVFFKQLQINTEYVENMLRGE